MLAQLGHVSIPLGVFVRLKTVIGRLKSKKHFKCVTLVLLFIIYLSVGKSEQEPLVVIVDCRVRSRLKYLFLIGCASKCLGVNSKISSKENLHSRIS